MNQKNSSIAFILSFFVAGLGMVYLKKWKKALVNILAAFVVAFILSFFIGGLTLSMFISISSGAWAYLEAEELNKQKSANQRLDPIVKTPVDKVEAQGTQGHP